MIERGRLDWILGHLGQTMKYSYFYNPKSGTCIGFRLGDKGNGVWFLIHNPEEPTPGEIYRQWPDDLKEKESRSRAVVESVTTASYVQPTYDARTVRLSDQRNKLMLVNGHTACKSPHSGAVCLGCIKELVQDHERNVVVT